MNESAKESLCENCLAGKGFDTDILLKSEIGFTRPSYSRFMILIVQSW
jgi:hypothetical protein